jgi:diadenylate cyclase
MWKTLFNLYTRLTGDAGDLSAVVVELLLIGLCVSWCLGVLRGTRGTRPLRGVLMILVVATLVVRVLAVQFGWVRLDLLYRYALFGLAFIALVAFQPELRRAIIRVGEVPFRRSGAPESQLIGALVKSAGFLSRNRYGALVENGTLIHADVSANLLNAIFFPNSPLHDLGVIIRGNQVVAANCQFPSAESDEIDAALGSRHLAAVGMSYETDALVLVISEETGVVSLADNGKLTRYLSLDDLAEELKTRLSRRYGEAPPASPRRRLLSSVWTRARRLLVVAPVTVAVWYLADQATLTEASVRVELNLRHDDPRYIVDEVEPKPLVFTATFSGPARAVDKLRVDAGEQPLKAVWALRGAYAAPGAHALGAGEIPGVLAGLREIRERGLAVIESGLGSLRFNVDELVSLPERVPVQPDAGSVRIAVERVEPAAVEVTLPRSKLDALPPEGQRYVRTLPLRERLAGLAPEQTRTFEHVPLEEKIGGQVSVLAVNPKEVTVTLHVVGQRRQIENVLVRLLVAPEVLERYEVKKNDVNEWRIDVEVVGEEAVVNALAAADIRAFANVTSDLMPSGEQPAEPQQLRLVDVLIVAPERVTVVGRHAVRVSLVPRTGGPP